MARRVQGLQVRVTTNVLVVDVDIRDSSLARDFLQGVLVVGTIIHGVQFQVVDIFLLQDVLLDLFVDQAQGAVAVRTVGLVGNENLVGFDGLLDDRN